MKLHAIMSVIAISGLAVAAQAEEGKIAYPEGYRDWPHVKSMVILEGHGLADPFQGIHHLYANGAALAGYRTGNWPDGAVIVFDLLKYAEGGHALQEGSRKLIGVMQRDTARYKDTGGWGYEGFAGDSKTKRLVSDMMGQCHGCHAGQEKTGFVFSRLRK